MTGRHRRGDPSNRGKGSRPSGRAMYWLTWYDEKTDETVNEQCFTAIEMETRRAQLRSRGIEPRVEIL